MVTIEQIERGLAEYVDVQLMPQLPKNSMYKVIIGTAATIAVKRAGTAICNLKHNPLVTALGLIDENGCVDIDIILDEAKTQIPDNGLRFESDKFGKLNLVITGDDVDELHKYIVRG